MTTKDASVISEDAALVPDAMEPIDAMARDPQSMQGHQSDTGQTNTGQADTAQTGATDQPEDARQAPRYTLLIRAAKLVSPSGEFICVIRDVSETGVSVRLFHALPSGLPLELHMPGGGSHGIEVMWERDNEVGFRFTQVIDVERLISQAGDYPKRGLRLGVCFPIRISTLTQSLEGMVLNLSQQGARFECDGLLAIEQNLRIDTLEPVPEFAEVRAKVRWRREHDYGVAFDDTFALRDFARLVARLQAPGLLER